jgi:hypothetical protein
MGLFAVKCFRSLFFILKFPGVIASYGLPELSRIIRLGPASSAVSGKILSSSNGRGRFGTYFGDANFEIPFKFGAVRFLNFDPSSNSLINLSTYYALLCFPPGRRAFGDAMSKF